MFHIDIASSALSENTERKSVI